MRVWCLVGTWCYAHFPTFHSETIDHLHGYLESAIKILIDRVHIYSFRSLSLSLSVSRSLSIAHTPIDNFHTLTSTAPFCFSHRIE